MSYQEEISSGQTKWPKTKLIQINTDQTKSPKVIWYLVTLLSNDYNIKCFMILKLP